MDYLLSKRELEILSYLLKGMTSKEIANVLFLSNHTVDTHRRNILRKSSAKNTTQLLSKFRGVEPGSESILEILNKST